MTGAGLRGLQLTPGDVKCGHVQCRVLEDRQDMRCTRAYGHEGNHLHVLGIGWCERPGLAGQDGRRGGHVTLGGDR